MRAIIESQIRGREQSRKQCREQGREESKKQCRKQCTEQCTEEGILPGSLASRSVTSFRIAAHGSVIAMAIIFQSASPSNNIK